MHYIVCSENDILVPRVVSLTFEIRNLPKQTHVFYFIGGKSYKVIMKLLSNIVTGISLSDYMPRKSQNVAARDLNK